MPACSVGGAWAVRELLTAAGYKDLPPAGMDSTVGTGIQAAPDEAHDQSLETYLGYRRADGFASPGGLVEDRTKGYTLPPTLALNTWAFVGRWSDDPEKATLDSTPGKIVYRFLARDLHLVLGPGPRGKPVRFRVLLDYAFTFG